MVESPKSNCESASSSIFCELGGLGEVGTLKMAISDHEGFSDRGERSDSFVVDMEGLFYGNDRDITPNSRITLQRNLSRKGSYRGEKKTNTSITNDTEITTTTVDASSKAALIGASMPDKSVIVPMALTEPINSQTPKAAAIEIRSSSRRYSGRRSPAWVDPWRVLFIFATLSSMGTILLIYFTLSIGKLSADDMGHAQQQ